MDEKPQEHNFDERHDGLSISHTPVSWYHRAPVSGKQLKRLAAGASQRRDHQFSVKGKEVRQPTNIHP